MKSIQGMKTMYFLSYVQHIPSDESNQLHLKFTVVYNRMFMLIKKMCIYCSGAIKITGSELAKYSLFVGFCPIEDLS